MYHDFHLLSNLDIEVGYQRYRLRGCSRSNEIFTGHFAGKYAGFEKKSGHPDGSYGSDHSIV